MERSRETTKLQKYRRHRIIGLLPALVLLSGGLYLGVTEGSWIPLLAGLLFLMVCVAMIAADHPSLTKERPINTTDGPPRDKQ
jgi:hypothetical protein